MIHTKLGPSVIYKEKLHKPRLPLAEKPDKKNDILLGVLEHIDANVEISSDVISNLQNAVLNQTALIDRMDHKHTTFNENLKNDMEKNARDMLNAIQNLNASFSDALENIYKKIDTIMNKLSEFDIAEEMDTTPNEVYETEEVPKDWISDDDEMGENNLNDDVSLTDKLEEIENSLHKPASDQSFIEIDDESDGD